MLPKGMYRLKIIGEKEGFLVGMNEEDLHADDVIFTGKLDDDKLLYEIASAAFLVQPSLYEGFGLPPLEALYLGTQPIISDIPVFREIYSELPVIFFNMGDKNDLRDKFLNSYSIGICIKRPIQDLYSYEHFVQKQLLNLDIKSFNNH